jgi:superfamily II DNA or RNA helicase
MKSKDIIQKEALDVLLPVHRGGAAIATGGGKTLIGLRHMNANYNEFAEFLVCAPKKSIFKEWISQANEHGLAHLIPHIKFTTYLSLPIQKLDYDVLYLDECHSLLPSHELWLTDFKGKILGLTGTKPKYKTSDKAQMVAKFCPILYEYKTDKAIKDKILNNYKIIVHTLRLDPAKTMLVQKKDKSWYSSEMATYNYWTNRVENASSKKEQQIMSVMRMKDLMNFPSKQVLARKILNSTSDKIILFANTQEQADSFSIPSYHSNNPQSEFNLDLFKQGRIMKLATVLQLNEGINVPELRQGIIMHSYGNERKTAQRIGRLLRLNPDDTATIHILCYEDTVDERWVKAALEDFDQSKITWM